MQKQFLHRSTILRGKDEHNGAPFLIRHRAGRTLFSKNCNIFKPANDTRADTRCKLTVLLIIGSPFHLVIPRRIDR